MFNASNYEYDCTVKCRLRSHANQITAALTKRSIADDQLAAFIAKSCGNYYDAIDDLGRSAVHMAASVGRYYILEWLLKQGAIINSRDYESGSSALHRAIYYGWIDCAVLLMRYGASLELLDEDTRCALHNVCRYDFQPAINTASCNELLVWGSNKNYNLGIGSGDGIINTPQSLDYFRKAHISITTIALGAYHSLFVDNKNRIYAVGHGTGGRLGTGNETSLTTPKKIKLPIKNDAEYIISVSVSSKHSLLLTNASAVYACGLNEDAQLGIHDAADKLLVFREVDSLRDKPITLDGVIARDTYSLAYSNTCIYVWGTNHGQMNMDASISKVPKPTLMKLPSRTAIVTVKANSAAIVVLTKDHLVFLCYKHKMRTIKPPNFEPVKSVSVTGGDSSKSGKGTVTALKLLLLTETNVIFVWYEMTQKFYQCCFSEIRLSHIDKIFYKSNQVLILSQGYIYKGKCTQIPSNVETANKKPAAAIWSRCEQNRTEVSEEHMIRIDLQRFTNVDRVLNIFCDDDFNAFAILQESSWKYFKLPTLNPENYSFKKLYNDISEMDNVHDVVFHVDGAVFPAHKFIVYARAPGLRDIIIGSSDKNIHLNLHLLTGKMFELMLKYIYTNYFPIENDFKDIQISLGPYSPSDVAAVCLIFYNFVKKFMLKDLEKILESYLKDGNYFVRNEDKQKYRFKRLNRKCFPELYDVRITCGADIEISAHKCILVSRLEYFEMMFSHTWFEQSCINLSTVPVEYMREIIDFLYSSDVEHFRKQNFSESYLYNMIVYCDQFFIERLRKVCEILLLDKINLRKCGEMLDFGFMYNCDVLKRGCMDFICLNLSRVLYCKSLEFCEPESLKDLSAHYRKMFHQIFDYRMITPYAEALEDEELISFVKDFKINLEDCVNENTETILKSGTKNQQKESKRRQYERQAISSMMESLNLDENLKTNNNSKSKNLQETQEIADKLQAVSKNWIKVIDKKDRKIKTSLDVVKANEVLMTEEKPKDEYTSLTVTNHKTSTPEKDKSLIEDTTNAKAYDINLADFSTPRGKLSQKQRKRLSSESNLRVTAAPSVSQTKAIEVQVQPNAWGLLPQSPPTTYLDNYNTTPPSSSAVETSSFANMIRATALDVSPSTSSQANQSFTQILTEERKQRDNYERMRTKSLALTQIEETAISELRQFYNADNVTDEVITIERKKRPVTMNFVVWQRN